MSSEFEVQVTEDYEVAQATAETVRIEHSSPDRARARELFERLLALRNDLGLYAEEYDTSTARFLGNYPQAFSHLALIEAAGRLILAERIQEIS